MPKVSAEHKDNVRRRIMDAAVICLARNEFQKLTTRELLAEAGISNGTFYNYFPTKEHLFEALAEELLSEDVRRIARETSDGGGAGVGLFSLLRDYMFTDPRAAIAVASFRHRTSGDDESMAAISRLNAWIIDEFTPLVEQAQAEGFLHDDLDPKALIELLDIVWDGLGHRAAQGSFQTSYEEVGRTVLQVMLRGAVAPTAAQHEDLTPQPVPPPERAWPV
jgi:AcrR family transcriptional regulator